MSKRYNVGVIGYGLSAKVFQIPLITVVPEFKLHAIVQRSPTHDNDAGRDHPDVKAYRTVDELFGDKEVEVVVVTTHPASHHELTTRALKAGKHVVVEKPFTVNVAEAEDLCRVSKETGRWICVYQNRRWDGDFVTVGKLVHGGALGRVAEFETHFDRHRPEVQTGSWKMEEVGGGVVWDLGSHLLDQVICLFGMPNRVTGVVGCSRVPVSDFEDTMTVLLHYDADEEKGRAGNMLVTAKAAVVSAEVEQLRFWVRGDQGSFKKFHLDCQEDQLKASMKPGDDGFGMEGKERYGVLTRAEEGGKMERETVPTVEPPTYAEFYRKLARALAEGKEELLPVGAEEGRDVIRLVELTRESSKLGRTLEL